MTPTIDIGGLRGSLRDDSLNRVVLRLAGELMPSCRTPDTSQPAEQMAAPARWIAVVKRLNG